MRNGMRTAYILKTWFKEPVDILQIITDKKKCGMGWPKNENDVVIIWEDYIACIHNSVGDSISSTRKVKVCVWEVFLKEGLDRFTIEKQDELGNRFFEEFFSECPTLGGE